MITFWNCSKLEIGIGNDRGLHEDFELVKTLTSQGHALIGAHLHQRVQVPALGTGYIVRCCASLLIVEAQHVSKKLISEWKRDKAGSKF
ncbi:hypothetical protein BWQ96_00680 [Gracilariopsis chorda]|uniref:Uncharacterized protein n=1 Tax=Gracilariopsis chorda TaxID=448386 RepID=A0A2V3J9W5_9FLOR|nr:hypothetical protein BWQ96_00680 [Gracilariopsis chorda]|eukprot:PXF49610.1 hypothetical protein BWQ96_00680 [Gracilariopsis chorda]